MTGRILMGLHFIFGAAGTGKTRRCCEEIRDYVTGEKGRSAFFLVPDQETYTAERMLSDIYAWPIDFFGIQEGDNFTVIYDQKYVDTVEIGHGTIWGARFEHGGKNYYAIPFMQDGKVSYWDEQGQSLRKNLLKAPLKYSRISSRFSASRLHPILRIRRQIGRAHV